MTFHSKKESCTPAGSLITWVCAGIWLKGFPGHLCKVRSINSRLACIAFIGPSGPKVKILSAWEESKWT